MSDITQNLNSIIQTITPLVTLIMTYCQQLLILLIALLPSSFKSYIGKLRCLIYNYTIGYFYTRIITRKVLDSLPDGSRILDIGIGTGYVYSKNSNLIKQKKLEIVGIDIDAEYINYARQTVKLANLEQHIKLINNDIYCVDSDDMALKSFDYVMFSDSYAVIPNVHDMITFCERYLKQDSSSKIVVVSTLFDRFNKYVSWIKRHIVYVSTVDYGSMMIKSDLEKYLEERKIDDATFTVIDDYAQLCKLMKSSTYMVMWSAKQPLESAQQSLGSAKQPLLSKSDSADENKEIEI